jgi:hypothetical protein
VLEVASYRLRLPDKYRLTAATATSTACPNPVDTLIPGSTAQHWTTLGGPTISQASGYSQVVAAANAEGSCIEMVLLPPYSSTSADVDPESASTLRNAQSVSVGPYKGLVGTETLSTMAQGLDGQSPDDSSQQPILFVEIPLSSGQTQDLAIGAQNLSQSALVSLVASGLTEAGATSNGGSPAATSNTTTPTSNSLTS